MLNEIYAEAELRMKETIEHYQRQFAGVRSGRANPGLVDGIRIDYYGTQTPLKQIAKISTPESNLIVIQPWDATVTSVIEKAINKSDLGLVPNSDGKIIRINVPALTEERRQQLVKQVKKMVEEGRVGLRNIRRDSNETIKELLKEKEISEDDSHKALDKVQKLLDDYIVKMEAVGNEKEKEILNF
jgi:ribosome recycling factor